MSVALGPSITIQWNLITEQFNNEWSRRLNQTIKKKKLITIKIDKIIKIKKKIFCQYDRKIVRSSTKIKKLV